MMYRDSINKKDLENMIELLQGYVDKMEEEDIKEIKLKCNTYKLYSNFISVAGVGYLPLYEYALDDMDLTYEDDEEGDD